MTFTAIMAWSEVEGTPDRVTRYQPGFATREDAQAFIAAEDLKAEKAALEAVVADALAAAASEDEERRSEAEAATEHIAVKHAKAIAAIDDKIKARLSLAGAFVVEAPDFDEGVATVDLSDPENPALIQGPEPEKAAPVTKRLSDTGRMEDELLATQELLAEAEYTIKEQAETITTLDQRLTAIEEGRANG